MWQHKCDILALSLLAIATVKTKVPEKKISLQFYELSVLELLDLLLL